MGTAAMVGMPTVVVHMATAKAEKVETAEKEQKVVKAVNLPHAPAPVPAENPAVGTPTTAAKIVHLRQHMHPLGLLTGQLVFLRQHLHPLGQLAARSGKKPLNRFSQSMPKQPRSPSTQTANSKGVSPRSAHLRHATIVRALTRLQAASFPSDQMAPFRSLPRRTTTMRDASLKKLPQEKKNHSKTTSMPQAGRKM